MGDADSSILDDPEVELAHVNNVLDVLNEDLTFFHDLEQRIVQTWSPQIQKYIYFRNFFLVMNFILLPLIITLGVCHGLKEIVQTEELKDVLQITITLLFHLIGGLGVLLYFGSLWTVYILISPQDAPAVELQRSEDDNGSTASTSEISAENASAETLPELVEEDFQDLLFKRIFAPQNNSTSSSSVGAGNNLSVDVRDKREESETEENDEERKVIPSQVDTDFKILEAL